MPQTQSTSSSLKSSMISVRKRASPSMTSTGWCSRDSQNRSPSAYLVIVGEHQVHKAGIGRPACERHRGFLVAGPFSAGAYLDDFQRPAMPEDFASLVIEIVRNGYVNGETVRLDGALRMGPL